jgi:hypothetical protein
MSPRSRHHAPMVCSRFSHCPWKKRENPASGRNFMMAHIFSNTFPPSGVKKHEKRLSLRASRSYRNRILPIKRVDSRPSDTFSSDVRVAVDIHTTQNVSNAFGPKNIRPSKDSWVDHSHSIRGTIPRNGLQNRMGVAKSIIV